MTARGRVFYTFERINEGLPVRIPWLGKAGTVADHRCFLGADDPMRVVYNAAGETAHAYRDERRRGWHIVPDGTRYIAVWGCMAGERAVDCGLREDVASHTVTLCEAAARVPFLKMEEWSGGRWYVIDLADLAMVPVKPPRTEGHAMVTHEARLPISNPTPTCNAMASYQRVPRTSITTSWPPPAFASNSPPPPPRPSDERIVEAWDQFMRWWEHGWEPRRVSPHGYAADAPPFAFTTSTGKRITAIRIDNYTSTPEDHRKARSAVLKARERASEERERMRVMVQIDDPEYA